jgi:hypothetical protein
VALRASHHYIRVRVRRDVGAANAVISAGSKNENTALALRDTVQGARQTMTNLADDTEALKHNFFLRGFFNRRGFYNLDTLTPAKYAGSEFVKKPRARVWVAAAGLFESRADGQAKTGERWPGDVGSVDDRSSAVSTKQSDGD